MGFGILLVGYFLSFAIALAGNSYFLDIIGGFIMTYAFSKLSSYNDKFRRCVTVSVAFTASLIVMAFLGLINVEGIVMTVASFVRTILVLLVHLVMFTALEDMAKGADDVKLARKAKRNISIIVTYFIAFCIVTLTSRFMDEQMQRYFDVMLYFYRLFWLIMNLLLIHSAYAKLYIEGTESEYAYTAEFKETNIKWLDNIRKKYYDSQKKAFEENEKLMRESREEALKNYVKKQKNKNNGKCKKKH